MLDFIFIIIDKKYSISNMFLCGNWDIKSINKILDYYDGSLDSSLIVNGVKIWIFQNLI